MSSDSFSSSNSSGASGSRSASSGTPRYDSDDDDEDAGAGGGAAGLPPAVPPPPGVTTADDDGEDDDDGGGGERPVTPYRERLQMAKRAAEEAPLRGEVRRGWLPMLHERGDWRQGWSKEEQWCARKGMKYDSTDDNNLALYWERRNRRRPWPRHGARSVPVPGTDASPATSTREGGSTRRARSAAAASAAGTDATADAAVSQDEVSALRTIAVPAPTFQRAVARATGGLKHVDLSWVRELECGRLSVDSVPDRCTLSICNPAFDSSDEDPPRGKGGVAATLINSPRSLIVLLRNGSAPSELLRRPADHFRKEGELEGVSREVQLLRARHCEEQRGAMLQLLRAQYAALSAQIGAGDVVRLMLAGSDFEPPYPPPGASAASTAGDATPATATADGDGEPTEPCLSGRRPSYNTLVVRERARKDAELVKRKEELRRRYAEEQVQKQVRDAGRQIKFEREIQKREQQRREQARSKAAVRARAQEQRRQVRDTILEHNRREIERKRREMAEGDELRAARLEEQRAERQRKMHEQGEEKQRRLEEAAQVQEREAQQRRDAYDEHVSELAKRQQAQEWHQREVAAVEQRRRRERQEAKRQETLWRAQERIERQRDRLEKKKEMAEVRMAQYNHERGEELMERAEENRVRGERRREVREQAVRQEEERRQVRVQQEEDKAAAYARLQEERQRQRELDQENERLRLQDRAAFIERQRQVHMFDKLKHVATMQRAVERIDFKNRKHKDLVRRTKENRMMLQLQQEQTERELQAEEVAAGKSAYASFQAVANPREVFKRVRGVGYGEGRSRSASPAGSPAAGAADSPPPETPAN